jgi:hypothetical protein
MCNPNERRAVMAKGKTLRKRLRIKKKRQRHQLPLKRHW